MKGNKIGIENDKMHTHLCMSFCVCSTKSAFNVHCLIYIHTKIWEYDFLYGEYCKTVK